MLAGCMQPVSNGDSAENTLNVVATTTMLSDLSVVIGGEHVSVNGLMGPGIDPHLYQASAGDVTLMQKAEVVVYNGLHLEGKMGEIFESLSGQGQAVVCIEEGLNESKLLEWEDGGSVHDPHIWFNVSLWKDAARIVADGFSQADPENKSDYEENLENYLKELDELDTYVRERVSEVPEGQRVLVTAHDAFNYFGNAYGFEVRGLQGISTDTEAGTADVSSLADFIVERQIKAIFVESSVPSKTIEALQAAVKAKGFDVAIGGELYSDSLGGEGSGAESYILTVKANIDTIVDALK
jgi:manganese/zinc/iron transport system substrate-binding protein